MNAIPEKNAFSVAKGPSLKTQANSQHAFTTSAPTFKEEDFHKLGEIIAEISRRALLQNDEALHFKNFCDALYHSRGDNVGVLKNAKGLSGDGIDAFYNTFKHIGFSANNGNKALFTTVDGYVFSNGVNEISYVIPKDKSTAKSAFNMDAAYAMVLLSINNPQMLPPNKLQIDNSTIHQRRLIEKAVKDINEAYGLELAVNNPVPAFEKGEPLTAAEQSMHFAPPVNAPTQPASQKSSVEEAEDSEQKAEESVPTQQPENSTSPVAATESAAPTPTPPTEAPDAFQKKLEEKLKALEDEKKGILNEANIKLKDPAYTHEDADMFTAGENPLPVFKATSPNDKNIYYYVKIGTENVAIKVENPESPQSTARHEDIYIHDDSGHPHHPDYKDPYADLKAEAAARAAFVKPAAEPVAPFAEMDVKPSSAPESPLPRPDSFAMRKSWIQSFPEDRHASLEFGQASQNATSPMQAEGAKAAREGFDEVSITRNYVPPHLKL